MPNDYTEIKCFPYMPAGSQNACLIKEANEQNRDGFQYDQSGPSGTRVMALPPEISKVVGVCPVCTVVGVFPLWFRCWFSPLTRAFSPTGFLNFRAVR